MSRKSSSGNTSTIANYGIGRITRNRRKCSSGDRGGDPNIYLDKVPRQEREKSPYRIIREGKIPHGGHKVVKLFVNDVLIYTGVQ